MNQIDLHKEYSYEIESYKSIRDKHNELTKLNREIVELMNSNIVKSYSNLVGAYTRLYQACVHGVVSLNQVYEMLPALVHASRSPKEFAIVLTDVQKNLSVIPNLHDLATQLNQCASELNKDVSAINAAINFNSSAEIAKLKNEIKNCYVKLGNAEKDLLYEREKLKFIEMAQNDKFIQNKYYDSLITRLKSRIATAKYYLNNYQQKHKVVEEKVRIFGTEFTHTSVNDTTTMQEHWGNIIISLEKELEETQLKKKENITITQEDMDPAQVNTKELILNNITLELESLRKRLIDAQAMSYSNDLLKSGSNITDKEKFSNVSTLIFELTTKFSIVITNVEVLRNTIQKATIDGVSPVTLLLTMESVKKSPVRYEALINGTCAILESPSFQQNHRKVEMIEYKVHSNLNDDRIQELVTAVENNRRNEGEFEFEYNEAWA